MFKILDSRNKKNNLINLIFTVIAPNSVFDRMQITELITWKFVTNTKN